MKFGLSFMARLALGTALAAGAMPTLEASAQSSLWQSGLVGQPEGIAIIADPAQWPKTFNEAPQLADLVKQGKLPAVKDRLPQDLMVIKPVREIGKYGGTWRRGFTGPGDDENGNRLNASDRPMLVDYTGVKVNPSLAKSWKQSEDGKAFTLDLRRGLRWSDGAPMTANDFVSGSRTFTATRISCLSRSPTCRRRASPAGSSRSTTTTVRFEFDVPFFLFEELMSGDTLIGGGQAVRQSNKRSHGAYAPAHYLKQFLPKYMAGGVDAANAAAKAEGFDSWVGRLHFKKDWTLNPALPVLGPWRTVQPINNAIWVMERNPFYWVVDTQGNQLPYIDRVTMTLAENLEVLNLRAMAGDYDLQERHIDLGKLPVILENQSRGKYKVHLDTALNGTDAIYHFNQSYDADPEIAKWLRNTDFRRALSLAIDRKQLNDTFWLGVATPGSTAPGESLPYFPGPGWREKWSTFDPKKANEMLDGIGLSKKDAQGFRVRTDNGQRLRLQVQAVQAFPALAEDQRDGRRPVEQGRIQADVKDTERNLAMTRTQNNEHHIMVWNNGGTELLYLFPRHAIPVDPTEAFMGPEHAKWFTSGGTQGKKPEDPNILKMLELFSSAAGQKSEERIKTAQEIWKILIDQQYAIGTVGQSPALMGVRLVSERLGNVPSRNCIAQHCRTPGGAHPETWFYKN